VIRYVLLIIAHHVLSTVVGAATPSIAPVILAILAYVAAAIQILGFVGVAKVCMSRRLVSRLITLFRKNQLHFVDTSHYMFW
jgi:hypothetical protein